MVPARECFLRGGRGGGWGRPVLARMPMTKNSYLRPVAGVGVCGTIPRDLAQKLRRPGVLNDMKPPHPFFPFSRCVPFKHSSTVPQTQPPRSNTVLRIKLPLLCRTDRTATSPEKTAKPRTVNVAKAMEEKKKKARCGLYFVAYCILKYNKLR